MNDAPRALQLVPPGRYIVAVSGGVDSMVLLDMLRGAQNVELIAAHADHGIRSDSVHDARLVASFCESHNILYITKKLHLSSEVSENDARAARYNFLRQVRIRYNANAIVTAHHQDDVIETAILNLLRGTGWRGLTALESRTDILRPLEQVPKHALIAYARTHRLRWREDSTNTDQRYTRNYIRHTIIPYLNRENPMWQHAFLQLIRKQQSLRRTIDDELNSWLTSFVSIRGGKAISRRYVWIMLPEREAYELMQTLFRRLLGHSMVSALVESTLVFIKTAKPAKLLVVNDRWHVRVTASEFIVEPRSSVVQ